MALDGKLNSANLEGHKTLQFIPIVIRYAAGTPSIVQNPTNESIALTDTGTGDVKLTLANASIAPLMVQASVLPTAAGTLGNLINLKTAPTLTVIELLNNSGADGATEVDPVDLHVLIIKTIIA
jgi:hypothetical protein